MNQYLTKLISRPWLQLTEKKNDEMVVIVMHAIWLRLKKIDALLGFELMTFALYLLNNC